MTLARRSRKVQKVQIVKPKRRKRKSLITRNVLANKSVVRMKYADTISIDPGAAGIAAHYFRCNSITDPDFTGAGHQPFTRDTYSTLYGAYRVLKSKIKVTPVFSANSAVNPGLWGVFMDSDSTLSYTEGTMIVEDPRTGGFGLHNGIQTTAYGPLGRPRTKSFNSKVLGPEGKNNVILYENNPSDTELFARYFCIWGSSVLANNPGSLEFMVEIEYTVELSAPLQITQS